MTQHKTPSRAQITDALLALCAGIAAVVLMYLWREWFSWSIWMYALGGVFATGVAFGKLMQHRAMRNLADSQAHTPTQERNV